MFGQAPSPPWPAWTIVDAAGACAAGCQVTLLGLSCGGDVHTVAALRNVVTATGWRGSGLMRSLLDRVLPWCDAHASATLLYSETPELYARFGFVPVAQHAFRGRAPKPAGEATARHCEPTRDAVLVARLLETRRPVSSLCAVTDDRGLTAQALAASRWMTFYDAELDALIVSEADGETLVIVDVVTPNVPPLARILGALGTRPAEVRTLFSPDRLDWAGLPVLDETGLMARGALPPAMHRPFMLPPTVEF